MEYKNQQLLDKINNLKLENGESKANLLEYKNEHPIKWYHNDSDPIDLMREAISGNPKAREKLLHLVPETKEFLEEIYKSGRSEVLEAASRKLNEMNEKSFIIIIIIIIIMKKKL